uniref:MARVEL domain-containing protein n=1 Tax=Globodera pallida TaxID=36090 RepID=A0A183BTE3_GLOPA
MAPKEFLAQQPDLFKPIQSINAVLILICLGSSSVVPGVGVLWFVGLLTKDCPGSPSPEFVYSSILTLLCGVGFWLAFGFASHVPPDGHSAGYIFTGIFLVAQVACYAIPVMIIYDRSRAGTEHEPIADVHSFGVTSDGSEQRYQTIQPERAFV